MATSPPADSESTQWMRRALDLARRGEALTSPNPMVGAVLVKGASEEARAPTSAYKEDERMRASDDERMRASDDERVNDGRIVAEGFHTYDGLRHAEIVALDAAGPAARGSTLYLNLEPCSHTGRTPPCTRAIIAAGVARVVAAMEDPNPAVAGRGFAELRAAGIDVQQGVLEEDARRLNEAFAKWITTGLPFVTLKAAMTLDHQLVLPATRGAKRRRWITSPASRAEVQRMRHASDALLTGIGTVLADDPLLTDRTGLPRRRPLLRVVLDSRLRLDPRSRLVRSAQGDLLVFTRAAESSRRARELRAAGIEVMNVAALAPAAPTGAAGKRRRGGKAAASQLPSGARLHSLGSGARPRSLPPTARPGSLPLDLGAVLAELGRRQITSVLLESGATLNDAALAADLVDKIRVFYAPFRAGPKPGAGAALREPCAATDVDRWRGRAVSRVRIETFGRDVAIEAYFHDVYAHPMQGNFGRSRRANRSAPV